MNTKEFLSKLELAKKACSYGKKNPDMYLSVSGLSAEVFADASHIYNSPCDVANFTVTGGDAFTYGNYKIMDLTKSVKALKKFSKCFVITPDGTAKDESGKSFKMLEEAPAFPAPIFEEIQAANTFGAQRFKDILTRLLPFMPATNNNKPAIEGLIIKPGLFEALDGFRLCRIEEENTFQEHFVIPTRCVKFLKGAINKSADNIKLSTVKTRGGLRDLAKIDIDGICYYTVLTNGEIIDTCRIIPDSTKYSVKVDRKKAIASFEYVGEFGKSDVISPAIISFMENSLILTDVDAFSSAELQISGDRVDIPDVGINPAFMVDALKTSDEDTVILGLDTPVSPVMFTSAPGCYGVVLPARINK